MNLSYPDRGIRLIGKRSISIILPKQSVQISRFRVIMCVFVTVMVFVSKGTDSWRNMNGFRGFHVFSRGFENHLNRVFKMLKTVENHVSFRPVTRIKPNDSQTKTAHENGVGKSGCFLPFFMVFDPPYINIYENRGPSFRTPLNHKFNFIRKTKTTFYRLVLTYILSVCYFVGDFRLCRLYSIHDQQNIIYIFG